MLFFEAGTKFVDVQPSQNDLLETEFYLEDSDDVYQASMRAVYLFEQKADAFRYAMSKADRNDRGEVYIPAPSQNGSPSINYYILKIKFLGTHEKRTQSV